MSICQSCGGLLGRDCYNPQECAEITADMARRAEWDRGVGSELHLDTDEWGELLYWLRKGLHQSEAGHRAFLQSIVTKLEVAGIKSND